MAVVDYLNSNNELIKVDSLKGPQMAILASDTNNVVDYLATNSIYVQVETPQGPQTAILIENAGVDGGLTPTQELTLAHIEYDSSEDKIAADVPLMTTLNSFYLGEQHKISSGGENIFFTNLTSDLVFTPVWAGIKDQSIPANQDKTGLLEASARVYGSDLINAIPVPINIEVTVPYDTQTILASNTSLHGIKIRVKEPLVIGDVLIYTIRKNDIDGKRIYKQKVVITEDIPADSDYLFWFDHPAEGFESEEFHAAITKDGIPLLVAQSTTADKPWVTFLMRTFEDRPIATQNRLTKQVKNADFEAENMGNYLVDCSGGECTITISDKVHQFTIGDYDQTFSDTSSVFIVLGTDTLVLATQNIGKEYTFVRVGATFRVYDTDGKFQQEGDV